MLVTAYYTTLVKATKFDQTGGEWHLGVKAICKGPVQEGNWSIKGE